LLSVYNNKKNYSALVFQITKENWISKLAIVGKYMEKVGFVGHIIEKSN